MLTITKGQFLALPRSSRVAYLTSRGQDPGPCPQPEDIFVNVDSLDGEWTAADCRELRQTIDDLEEKLIYLQTAWYDALYDDQRQLAVLYDLV
jgi:hypothetical protein